MDHVDAEELASRILSDADAGRIFVRAFRWVLGDRFHFQEYEADRSRELARNHEAYKYASEDLRQIMGPVQAVGGSASISEIARADLESTLARHLVVAVDSEVFPVMLALLDLLDRQAGQVVRKAFFARPVDRAGGHRVDPDTAFPSHWAAFGTDALPPDVFPPEYEVPRDFQRLAAYFGRLTVTHAEQAGDIPVALHPDSAREGVWTGDHQWKVAVIDLLADFNELDFQSDAVRFWIPGIRPAVEGRIPPIADRMRWALDLCRGRGASLMVFPELSADAALVAQVQEELSRWGDNGDSNLPLAVLGKVHVPVRAGSPRYRNAPAAVTRAGVLDWPYWKAQPYEAPWDGVRLQEALDGEPPPYIVGLDTSLGRVAVVVCYDFMIATIRTSLLQMRPNVVVVVAMTNANSVRDFRNFAAGMAAGCRAVTVFCNSTAPFRFVSGGIQPARSAAQTLGFVRSNTRMHRNELPRSHRHDPRAMSTVAIYTVRPDGEPGLRVSSRSFRFRQ